MKVYTYSEARQKLAAVLDEASREGSVRIRRRDGTTYVVQPVRRKRSPLDVGGVRTDISPSEIVEIVREERRRGYPRE